MSACAHTCVCVCRSENNLRYGLAPPSCLSSNPLLSTVCNRPAGLWFFPPCLGSRQEVRSLALCGPGFQTQTPILPQQALCPLSLLCTPVQCFWKWDCWLARWLSGYRWLCEVGLLEFHLRGPRGGRKELWLLWLSSNLCPLAHASLCHTK